MLKNEKISARLGNATGEDEYFLDDSLLNTLIKEAENIRFDNGQLVLRFKSDTATISLREKIIITTKDGGLDISKVYNFCIEKWGDYERVGTPVEERMVILL